MTNFKILLCFILIELLLAENQLISSLQEQAKKIAATIPSDYEKLVMEIKTNGLDGYDACEVSGKFLLNSTLIILGFDKMISKYDFS